MMPCAEIGNIGEVQRLVSAARSGAKDGGHGGIEEEVIELEFFDRAIHHNKLHTHNAYCPNCRSPISKVILRIKRETAPPIPDNNLDLLGCLACFRIFLPNKTTTDERTTEEQQESHNAPSQGICIYYAYILLARSHLC